MQTIIDFLNLCDSFSFSFIISSDRINTFKLKLDIIILTMFHFTMKHWKSACIYSYFPALTSSPISSHFQILHQHRYLLAAKFKDLAKFVSFAEIFFTLQLFALENLPCASHALGCMSLCFKSELINYAYVHWRLKN